MDNTEPAAICRRAQKKDFWSGLSFTKSTCVFEKRFVKSLDRRHAVT